MKVRRNLFITIAGIFALAALSSCGAADKPTSDSSSAVDTAKDESSFSVSADSEDISEAEDVVSTADSSENITPMTFDDLPYGPGGLDEPPAVRPAEENREEFTSDGRPVVYFRKDTEQSIISEDGAISQSFEYELNEEENCIDVTFVTVNNSDESCTLFENYDSWALTDKTDLNTAFMHYTVLHSLSLDPGQTKTKTVSHELPEDWSILKLDVILSPDTFGELESAGSDESDLIYADDVKTVYWGSASFAIEITR